MQQVMKDLENLLSAADITYTEKAIESGTDISSLEESPFVSRQAIILYQ